MLFAQRLLEKEAFAEPVPYAELASACYPRIHAGRCNDVSGTRRWSAC
jgi:hypothetical protein